MPNQPVRTISVSGVISMHLHAMNNEKGEQNVVKTRKYTIVDPQGKKHTVNGVSGNMMKHILGEHLRDEAADADAKLCGACRTLDPNRISNDDDFIKSISDKMSYEELVDAVIRGCAMDDALGMMFTGSQAKKFARKSVVEFSEVVALPDEVFTDQKLFLKLAKDPQAHKVAKADSEEGGDENEEERESAKKSNAGSNLLHKPTSSGNYAVQMHIEADRLSMNDYNYRYALDDEDRAKRYKSVLAAALNAFVKPAGANRNTQMPHISDFRGVVTYSTGSQPAPMISALFKQNSFIEESVELSQRLNKIKPNTVHALPFESLSDFADRIIALMEMTPGKKG